MLNYQNNDYFDFIDHVNVIMRNRKRNRIFHVEHVDENSKFSHHFYSQFVNVFIDSFNYEFIDFQQSFFQRTTTVSISTFINDFFSRILNTIYDQTNRLNDNINS